MNLVKTAIRIAGLGAPRVLGQYALLTYLNRTSRGRPIRKVPTLAAGAPAGPPRWDADIVVPVYNDFEGTTGLLDVLRREAAQFDKIIIVHDASTDARLSPLLRDFEEAVPNASLIENERNVGFVKTCNRGLEASLADVIILNTDIELPPDALGRLMAVLRSDSDIATVTPFSSAAYGAGFPHLNYANARPFEASTAQIDRAFQAIGPFAPIDVPRGVGFCMAISRSALDRVGTFDTAFGEGYGEEADFSLRAAQAGFRNVIAPNVYVFHHGGQSFGSSARQRAQEGLIRLVQRHPHYAPDVWSYLERNEARAVALAALVALVREMEGELVPANDGPTNVCLCFKDECYAFDFADVLTAKEALSLARLNA